MIGKEIMQPTGYRAFIPDIFPKEELFKISQKIQKKLSDAERLIGKLDGLASWVPDIDFYISMYVMRDATHSAQIEGTKADMKDAIELSSGINDKSTDADDILHYIEAINYAMKRLGEFPFSLRIIKEIHKILMTNARATHFSDPWEFRKSQNWIGGTSPKIAKFVPPPPYEMNRALNDLEKFLHNKNYIELLQVAILHAQFETIHPFLDWNGRTGRMLITMFLFERKILEKPLLFLSSYFRKHQNEYYDRLNSYHNGYVEEWIEFFLDAVIETAQEAIEMAKNIQKIRNTDIMKISALGKRESESGIKLLNFLFSCPIITAKNIVEVLGFSRAGAGKVIERFVNLQILMPYEASKKYGKRYVYQRYFETFL